jgi:dimethylamine/trimethylamine dehydrogenase
MATNPKYQPLFEPISFGPKTMRNRFWQTSHCTGFGSERPGTQAGFRGMKAEGGWAVVCTEFCSIHPETDEYPWHSARLWDGGDVINLGHMCDEVHRHGSLAGVQLWYNGSHSPNLESREIPHGVSGLPSNVFPERNVYDAMSDEDDIKAIINMYVLAAKRAQDAGFDIVEVSGSDTTLPLQFLERRYNRRTDRYGGSLENRARFYIEIMAALKRAVGDRLAVTTRFETDTINGEIRIQHFDEGLRFVDLMHAEGVCDLWSVKIGDYEEWGEDAGSSRFRKVNWMQPFVSHVKGIVGPKVPVVSNGRFTSPDDMIAALSSGQCDIIGAARPSIADPFLPTKIAENRLDDIRECIGCNMCVSRMQQQALLSCTQNATAGEEYRRGWHPEKFDRAPNSGSVLVVGAGPAGMECAMVLGKRGYTVHLRDAAPELGGHWRDVARYPRCAEYGRVISYRQAQLAKLKNVEVHLGIARMSADDVLNYGADKVVIATGAHWATDGLGAEGHRAIKGVDAARPEVLTPEQVMAGKAVPGNDAVVLDGDGYLTGVSMAEILAERGKRVTLVTNMNNVAEFSRFTMELPNNKRMLYERNVRVMTNYWAQSFAPGHLSLFYLYRDTAGLYELEDGHWGRRPGTALVDLACDALVLVTSRVPNGELYAELKRRQSEWQANEIQAVYRIGDCHAPRHALNAVFDGHRLAREFESPHPQHPLPFIRERQVWGHATYPKLGDPRPKVEVN